MLINFYGHSDDLIEIRINGMNHDEVGAYISGEGCYARALEVRSIGGAHGIRVHAIYDGCWSFAAGQIEDGLSLPSGWDVRTEQEHPYSARLVVDTNAEMVEVTNQGGKPLSYSASEDE